DNGGPTLTMALFPGSPTIDAGNTASAPATDQRGFPRPVGPAADIGAYEFGSPGYLQVALGAAARLDLLATGPPNRSTVLETSADLTAWLPISTNRFAPDGTFLFHDIPSGGRKFHRLRLD
ncbi:MAG TPA: choice-of-anchor Q domain-containing protein, partial [Verrucomicrobiae bacterium]